mgnify:CR=1 FL=1
MNQPQVGCAGHKLTDISYAQEVWLEYAAVRFGYGRITVNSGFSLLFELVGDGEPAAAAAATAAAGGGAATAAAAAAAAAAGGQRSRAPPLMPASPGVVAPDHGCAPR